MSDREVETLSANARRAAQALASLPAAPPPAAFRERLKRDFVSGAIERAPGAAHRGEERPRRSVPARGVAPARWFARPLSWAAAAAAAVVLVLGGQRLNAGAPWQLVSVTGEGIATVDGRPVPLNHTEELVASLTPGARLRVPPGCRLEIASRGVMGIQMASETDATVPQPPGRWFGRQVSAEIQAGEWRITTGPGFGGCRLAIATPSAHVEVTGTTLAVICEPAGTCVCVYEGRVKVGRDRSDMAAVEQGRRRYVFVDDTREPESDVMRPGEVTALADFRQAMAARLEAD